MMRKAPRPAPVAAIVMSAALLSGCAEVNFLSHWGKKAVTGEQPPAAAASPAYKVGKAYQVNGVWYYPQEDWDYDETGIASWYGPDFHGKLTANGEVFDQMAITAAHKTLPMPSMVRVTNLDNGRSLVVRVNDRGPFVNGRIIDLSKRSAQLLGIEGRGTAKVRVQILADESRVLAGKMKQDAPGAAAPQVAAAPRESVSAETLSPPPGIRDASKPVRASVQTASPTAALRAAAQAVPERSLQDQTVEQVAVKASSIFIQAGAFSRHDNALRLSAKLSHLAKPQLQQVSVKGQTVYRVRIGPLSSVEEADRLLDQVLANGHHDARVVVD